MAYKNLKDPKTIAIIAMIDFKYNNSKRGFIVNKIASIFKPCNLIRKTRNTSWPPKCTKEDVYQKLLNHMVEMKKIYPQTDGFLCTYCKAQFTYITNYRVRGDMKKRSKSDPKKDKNFSIDRWDPNVTYTYDNIKFCCLGCNNRKSSSTPMDWENFIKGGKFLNETQL
tara:strand:+ start:19 stop:522 length:504 start_codon:yes stop_codon:yes gene_type:complete